MLHTANRSIEEDWQGTLSTSDSNVGETIANSIRFHPRDRSRQGMIAFHSSDHGVHPVAGESFSDRSFERTSRRRSETLGSLASMASENRIPSFC